MAEKQESMMRINEKLMQLFEKKSFSKSMEKTIDDKNESPQSSQQAMQPALTMNSFMVNQLFNNEESLESYF